MKELINEEAALNQKKTKNRWRVCSLVLLQFFGKFFAKRESKVHSSVL